MDEIRGNHPDGFPSSSSNSQNLAYFAIALVGAVNRFLQSINFNSISYWLTEFSSQYVPPAIKADM